MHLPSYEEGRDSPDSDTFSGCGEASLTIKSFRLEDLLGGTRQKGEEW